MGRKSSIDKLPPKARRLVSKRATDPAATLDSVRDELVEMLPASQVPSRSALHRKFKNLGKSLLLVKASNAAAQAFATELGEVPEGDIGRALVAVVQAMANGLITDIAGDDEREAKLSEVHTLAKIVKLLNEGGSVAMRTAEKVAAQARDKLLRDQREKLSALGKSGAVSPEALALVMKAAYDL